MGVGGFQNFPKYFEHPDVLLTPLVFVLYVCSVCVCVSKFVSVCPGACVYKSMCVCVCFPLLSFFRVFVHTCMCVCTDICLCLCTHVCHVLDFVFVLTLEISRKKKLENST